MCWCLGACVSVCVCVCVCVCWYLLVYAPCFGDMCFSSTAYKYWCTVYLWHTPPTPTRYPTLRLWAAEDQYMHVTVCSCLCQGVLVCVCVCVCVCACVPHVCVCVCVCVCVSLGVVGSVVEGVRGQGLQAVGVGGGRGGGAREPRGGGGRGGGLLRVRVLQGEVVHQGSAATQGQGQGGTPEGRGEQTWGVRRRRRPLW